MKIVLDTNIWISGLLLPNSRAGKIIKAWRKNQFSIITSPPILRELERVLSYPKIRKRIQWNQEQIERYIMLLRFFTEFTSNITVSVKVERDHNDSAILATFLSSKADYLITGDNDLLSLKDDYAIITPTEFTELIF